MSNLIETLASFAPALITRRLAAHPTPISAPTTQTFPSAVLFTDISGFTTLTEHLAQKGPEGAEELTAMLNTYFGQLIDLISAHGGDIVKFAGDSLIALWPALDATGQPQPALLAEVTLAAARCSLAVQAQLNTYQAAPDIHLSLKLALSAGEVLTMHLGGVYGRWEFLVTGAPLVQVSRAGNLAGPGDTILSPEAWALISHHAHGVEVLAPLLTPTPSHPSPSGEMRLLNLPPAPLPPLTPTPPPLPPETEPGLRAYIPGAILARLAAGQTGWLAELRRVTILFVNLPDLDYSMPLEQAQRLMETLQTALYRFEGSLNKLSVDDKGVTLVAALGLPPLAHEDDAARGVRAALSIQAELRQLGWSSAIGVTSGWAFCGTVGNDRRREYTMIGDVVNLAARLMQAAPGQILNDAATYQAAQSGLAFEALPPLKVKGKAEPVAVYRPLGQKSEAPPLRQTELVGRETERDLLAGHLQTLLRGSGGLILLEGEAGIGKSCLIADLFRQADQLGVTSLVGAANAIDKSTPYHAWRPIFQQMFSLDALPDDPTLRCQRIIRQLENDFADTPQAAAPLTQLAPLLEPVLLLDWPDNAITAQMTGKVRADNTYNLLVRLLQQMVRRGAAVGRPYLLVIEDAHWLNSASWALAAQVARRVQPLLLVVVNRPMSAPLPPEYSQLRQSPEAHRLTLGSMTPTDMVALVCQRLGVSHLPEALAQLIYTKTDGNPFFGEELAYALRDAGLITIANGQVRLTPQANDLDALSLPDTVQGVITSRIDRLTPAQQLTLKVASVIGREFEFNTLRDIHPIEADRIRLTDYLTGLGQLDITQLESPEPDPAYIFKHIITQEVAYEMMLFSQRRQLHQAVANWYEQTYTADLSPYYSLLAYHWRAAGNTLKAITYLEQAGNQALYNYANAEAVDFFSEALALSLSPAPPLPHSPTIFQRAGWELKLGEAYINWAKLSEGRVHLEQGLTLLGQPLPHGQVEGLMGLTRQIVRQSAYRLWPAHYLGRQAQHSALLLEAARAYEGLTAVYYFANQSIAALYAALRSLNLAEAAGPSPELARGYASVGVILSFVPLHRQAESYCQQALAMTRQIHNLPARAWVALLSGLYYTGVGRWPEGRDLLEQVVSLSEQVGDHSRRDDGLGNLAVLEYLQGHLAESARLFAQVQASAERRSDAHNLAWALRGRVYPLIPQGCWNEALTLLEQMQQLLAQNPDIVDEPLYLDLYGLLALVHLHRNEPDLARQAADRSAALIAQTSPTSYLSLPGYAAVAETYLALWEIDQASQAKNVNRKSEIKRLARQACKALRGFARVFSIGQPQAYLHQGEFEWLSGRPFEARRWWRQGLAAAERLQMPYPEALLHLKLAHRLPPTDPARAHHQTQANQILSKDLRLEI